MESKSVVLKKDQNGVLCGPLGNCGRSHSISLSGKMGDRVVLSKCSYVQPPIPLMLGCTFILQGSCSNHV